MASSSTRKQQQGAIVGLIALMGLVVVLGAGCQRINCMRCNYQTPPPHPPNGYRTDPILRMQEDNAEASDFVFYQNEFKMNKPILNYGGQDHIKEVAMRLQRGEDVPIVIERSMTAVDPDSEYEFPIHPNPELDNDRRELVVRSLLAMGVADADQRVLVASPYSDGMDATEASSIYQRGIQYGGGLSPWNHSIFGGGGFGPFSGFGGWGF